MVWPAYQRHLSNALKLVRESDRLTFVDAVTMDTNNEKAMDKVNCFSSIFERYERSRLFFFSNFWMLPSLPSRLFVFISKKWHEVYYIVLHIWHFGIFPDMRYFLKLVLDKNIHSIWLNIHKICKVHVTL